MERGGVAEAQGGEVGTVVPFPMDTASEEVKQQLQRYLPRRRRSQEIPAFNPFGTFLFPSVVSLGQT